ncbi:MAG: hypothetical protein M1820_010705 [Bogoriella megaspora]|nr:MAG: hypothetical protein M1820_010705 [Bogoriella megaspora]
MQSLPYAAVTNSHLSSVYELYWKAFEAFRKVPEIRTVKDNDAYCGVLTGMLDEHLAVIPRLAMGVLEIQDVVQPDATDKFMTSMLRSRISRRVIAQQHLSLTETFHSPWHFPDAKYDLDGPNDLVGEVLLRCNGKETIQKCASTITELMRKSYGSEVQLPEVRLQGHLDATFPYTPSILEYIIGELLRNSIQATVEQQKHHNNSTASPIEVLICEAEQHVIIRISDKSGGVPRDLLPYLWSFTKGPRKEMRLENLNKVPKMAATMQELGVDVEDTSMTAPSEHSLTSLTSRPPDLKLGMGLPISRIYAEYWAGSLELHSLEGYGVDAFLQIPKLGNKNERLATRASMDAI